MAARFVPTMRLSNIIQMITLSGQSGILRAIRGQDSARQMGQIRFVNGQAVSVLFGQMVGENALNALMGWGECMYSFDEIASDGAEPDGYYSSSDGGQYGTTPLPSGTGSWPSYGGYPSSPSYAPSSPPQYPPNPGPPSPYPPYGSGYSQSAPNTGYPQQPPNTGYPGGGAPNTGYSGGGAPNPSDPYYWQTPPTPTASSLPGSNGFRPDLLESVPYQVGIAEPIEHLPLDRRERMILLLINGQRSMLDLVRLTHRGEREIYAVLQHLALLGLIQFRR
ncbi:MAG TPA: DUF4388 domain-containing protein [Ktedonobacterales bacterium]